MGKAKLEPCDHSRPTRKNNFHLFLKIVTHNSDVGDNRRKLLARAESAALSWHPVSGGRRTWLVFEDDKTFDLGPDADGTRIRKIAQLMLTGRYYPPDAVRVFGRFTLEDRPIRVGDRLVQEAPLFCRWGGPLLPSSVEIIDASASDDECRLGYVTTEFHFGRGIWRAVLARGDGRLSLHVKSTSMPGSWLFWLGLPVARYLQLRARRRAVEEFRRI